MMCRKKDKAIKTDNNNGKTLKSLSLKVIERNQPKAEIHQKNLYE